MISAGSIDPAIEVRLASLDDVPGLHRAQTAVYGERRFFGRTEAVAVEKLTEIIAEYAAAGSVFCVVVSQGDVVGWCNIWRRVGDSFRHCGALGMGLLPPYRGRGIGHALMTFALTEARHAGIWRIELEVFANNLPAIELYEKMGFVREGLKQQAVVLDEGFDDIVCMARIERGEAV